MRLKSLSAVFALVVAALFMSAAPSSANSADGTIYKCGRYGNFPLCIYYYANAKGSKTGIFGKVHNYAANPYACSSQGCLPYRFEEGSTLGGYGTLLKNHAEFVYNYNDTSTRVYYNSGWSGPADQWDPYGWGTYFGNLNYTFNNNASQDRLCGEC
ncbi:hypothetical protein ACFVX6_22620 [Streptomyces sp. NPDC058289]|uniref:hypothetical protein n=1 Tax=Streptomyces sp. NPDC058289 TaxID=3346425 RepID=UPI0036EF29F6